MTGDDTASLVYLGVLFAVLTVAFLAAWRGAFARLIYGGAVWILIFGALIVGFDWYAEESGRQAVMTVGDGGAVEVPLSRDGHFHITLDINGVAVPFVVDTGATNLVLSTQDAGRVGIDVGELRFFGRAFTANGEVRTADVRLEEVRLANLVDRGVPAVVNGGEMRGSLLGMSYLSSFGRIEIEDGVLRLTR